MTTKIAETQLKDLREYLLPLCDHYESPTFLEQDPIQLPARYSKSIHQEIIGFLVATFAWGNRKSILKNGEKLCRILGKDPYDFCRSYKASDKAKLERFVHRTFQTDDLHVFLLSLRNLYESNTSLEHIFMDGMKSSGKLVDGIDYFRSAFLTFPHDKRLEKHIASPKKGSAAKRICMYLRWMCRPSNKGVDFGIWQTIPRSSLLIPLDVHTARVARSLGILKRKQNDAKAVEEIMEICRIVLPDDPSRIDFALFGLGSDPHFKQFSSDLPQFIPLRR